MVLNSPEGSIKTALTGGDGVYALAGLTPGTYSITASAPQLVTPRFTVALGAGAQSLDLVLRVASPVDRSNRSRGRRSSSQHQCVFERQRHRPYRQRSQSLADDPDDLQEDLQALAGPATGPDGNEIFVDGFSGGQLPPRQSIREVRLNQNLFAPEYDKIGLGPD